MGFPLEIVTGLLSAAMGGMLTIWGMKMKHEALRSEMQIAGLNAQSEAYARAREYKDPKFQFTRRIIALTAVFAILLLPKLAAIFQPDILVTVGWTEWNPGFWFFTDGKEVTTWQTVQGLTLTPLDTHVMTSIVGLYFGASAVKNA